MADVRRPVRVQDDGHDVESVRRRRRSVPRQVHPRGPGDASLLAAVHLHLRGDGVVRPTLDLHEDQLAAVAGDKVDFPRFAAEVAEEDAVAVPPKVGLGDALAPRAYGVGPRQPARGGSRGDSASKSPPRVTQPCHAGNVPRTRPGPKPKGRSTSGLAASGGRCGHPAQPAAATASAGAPLAGFSAAASFRFSARRVALPTRLRR